MTDERGLKIVFYWDHRMTKLTLTPHLFWPSVYRHPFLSVRFLCFWFTHDWNPRGVVLGGGGMKK